MAQVSNFRRLKHADPQLLPSLAHAAKRRERWTTLWIVVIAFVASAAVASLVLGAVRIPELSLAEPRAPAMAIPSITADFSVCRGGMRDTCVVDGDTFWLRGTKYRIADIDTPEVSQPACGAEKALGDRATRRLAELLSAGAFVLEPVDRDEDRYGRKLRTVTRDGTSLGAVLVAEGLAHRWDGGKHPWC